MRLLLPTLAVASLPIAAVLIAGCFVRLGVSRTFSLAADRLQGFLPCCAGVVDSTSSKAAADEPRV
jgi:hypothetical protein